MPRSPSPPRLPHRPRTYRDDSPPYPPRDDYRFAREPRYRNTNYDRNERPDWRDRERDDDRDWDYQRPRYPAGRTSWFSRDRERDERMTARSPLPRRPVAPPMDRERERERGRDERAMSMAAEGSAKARSEGTPEEGQITSPVHPPPAPPVLPPISSMAGLPARPHSPPIRSPAIRRRTRSPPPFRRVERDSWRDRDREVRERDWDRDRFFRRRSPSPYSPPVRRRRSPSVSSASTPSRSSRLSPLKRALSPVSDRRRSRSPSENRSRFEPPHSPSPPPRSELHTPSPPPATAPEVSAPAPAPAPARPVPIAVPLSGFNQFAKRPPPTGPRSMGGAAAPGFAPPTGPRALAHLYGGRPPPTGPRAYAPLSTASLASAGRATAMISTPVSATPPREEIEPPRASRAPSETPSAHSTSTKDAPPSGPRLSWSERKTLPAQTPTPGPAPGLTLAPVAAVARATASPYAVSPSVNVNTVRTPYNQPASSSPTSVAATAYPVSAEQEDVKPQVEEPVLSEDQLAEMRAKEEEARVLAELPPVAVPFGGAQWEIDLANHHHHYTSLLQNTLRTHSIQRHAAMALADAEAERAAAVERRRICEGQLMAGMVGVGGMFGAV
ncbi:hypothetical protein I350_00585 [Cryptococcus amylolentus CBS 6273]|uniref:Uncharacterized protein n=1 Tax=Cryptococcus amylolentus CBS 6273 TaxID=1296118 RepID=A0A1E3KFD1_9TREE|nr:hypothetical protein I350_00585 [Cryptococcus amylolentus CBS 6273]